MTSSFYIELKGGWGQFESHKKWSEFSEEEEVEFMDGGKKIVSLAKLPVTRVSIFHDDLEANIDVPDGCRAYYALRSQTVFYPGQPDQNQVIGKIVGIVKDGKVIEEKFINIANHTVMGIRP